jgi:FMN phosphatase YigB (HAD superfamily)
MKHYLFDLDDTLYMNPSKKSEMYDITPDDILINLLNNCPHPKYIYTNAMYIHANLILNKLEMQEIFKKIYSRDTIPLMKPEYNSAVDIEKNIIITGNTKNNKFVFFDDLLPNLKTGKKKGWVTIWISPLYRNKKHYEYIDHAFPDIKTALFHCNEHDI